MLKKDEFATAEEIIEFSKNRLASYKKPETVIFVDSLPRGTLGKILKRVLRERYGNP